MLEAQLKDQQERLHELAAHVAILVGEDLDTHSRLVVLVAELVTAQDQIVDGYESR